MNLLVQTVLCSSVSYDLYDNFLNGLCMIDSFVMFYIVLSIQLLWNCIHDRDTCISISKVTNA